jgi:uncharacterized protein YoxC
MDQSLVIIISIVSAIGIIVFLTAVVFIVYAAIELRKAAATLNSFLKMAEDKMAPVLEEAEQSLKNIKKISDDVATVTASVKTISFALSDTAQNIRNLSNIVEEVRKGVSLRVLGLKTGIKTALNVLIQEISKKQKKEV